MARRSPVNVQMVSNRREGLSEIDIKKFFRKCKKQEIIQEYLDKTSFHLTRSEKQKEKRRKNAFFRKKHR